MVQLAQLGKRQNLAQGVVPPKDFRPVLSCRFFSPAFAPSFPVFHFPLNYPHYGGMPIFFV